LRHAARHVRPRLLEDAPKPRPDSQPWSSVDVNLTADRCHLDPCRARRRDAGEAHRGAVNRA
jgi:hypothetical protein